MTPVGGQSQYNFTFASRAKRVHGWFGLNGVYHIAYLCERHLYVQTAGVLTDISPTTPITSPTPVGQGGYGDGRYSVGMELATTAFAAGATSIVMQQPNPGWIQPTMDIYNTSQPDHLLAHIGKVLTFTGTALVLAAGAENAAAAGDELMFDWYGKPRPLDSVAAIDKIPSWYSLDNFGSILYAMTSADGRLLMWDPAQGAAGNVANLNAASAISITSPTITMPVNPGGVVTAGMSVYNKTLNLPVGTVLTYTGTTLTLTANALNAGVTGNSLAFGNVAVVQPATTGRGPVPKGRGFVITNERYVMMFSTSSDGTVEGGKANRFAWCDQENPGAWDYSDITSQAGFLDIEPASPIITARARSVTASSCLRQRIRIIPSI